MTLLNDKFVKLGVENAPGQEGRKGGDVPELRGESLQGAKVDFSHGDVDAFEPIPGTLDLFIEGVKEGGAQAYTEYRGRGSLRADVAEKLSDFTKVPLDGEKEVILTPGTQGALFLAMGSLIVDGDRVAIVEPDYFANRKLVNFFGGEIVPIRMHYETACDEAGIDLEALENAFRSGVQLFLFSNPNNPVGTIYSEREIRSIAEMADCYDVTLIVDELYSRQVFDSRIYTHMCTVRGTHRNQVTIIGPSKTESLSGYRLGVAYGDESIIDRMEKLQAIVSLRAGGYSQAVFRKWFSEPEGWMKERIAVHQAIRDDLVALFDTSEGVKVRPTEAGSYLFVEIPDLDVSIGDFVKILRAYANVTVTPGTEFGPQFTHHFRINFSQDHKKAVEAVKRILIMINRYRKQ